MQAKSKKQAAAAEAAKVQAEDAVREKESTIRALQCKMNDQESEMARIKAALEEATLKVARAGKHCASLACTSRVHHRWAN